MENEKKRKLHEEQLREFKYRVGYKVNESPRYRPLVNDGEEFDNLPVEIYNTEDGQPMPPQPAYTNEAGEQEDAPIPGGGKPPAEPNIDQPPGMETPPEGGAPEGELPAKISSSGVMTPEDPMAGEEPPMGADPMAGDAMGGVAPEAQVDDLQNEIIKHNISAMQSIHDKLQNLDSTVMALNGKLDSLNAEVEEVREPTNSEKLMNKTNVSYPYYFNLNDFWQGNWFDEKRKGEEEKGVRELPDGSFIADFDDLPQKSKQDVQNSFNQFESVLKKKSKLNEDFPLPGNPAPVSAIDGVANKRTAIDRIYKAITPLIQGTFRDEDWRHVRAIWNKFNEMDLDWDVTRNSEYFGGMPPQGKTWYFEISFVDKNGKPQKIGGNLTANGSGGNEYPLERYDISVVLY